MPRKAKKPAKVLHQSVKQKENRDASSVENFEIEVGPKKETISIRTTGSAGILLVVRL